MMRTEQTNSSRTAVFQTDDQALHHRYHVILAECPVLRNDYQALYKLYRAHFERCPTSHEHDPDEVTFHQALHTYSQSLQELRRLIQHFRHTLHAHRVKMQSYRIMQNGVQPAVRPHIRSTILLGVAQERDSTSLKESIQQAGNHRVFVVTDRSQVLCLMQNVHIDLLVLDDEMTPLAGIELYDQVQSIAGPRVLPTIIMGDGYSPLYQAEQARSYIMRLERPIEVDALVRAIDQLLA